MKISGRNIFFSSFLNFFLILNEKLFRLLAKKLQEFVKTTFYVSRGTNCGLIFFKFETFRIFCRNIWHGSQNSIYVSRVKIAEKNRFFVFFPEFFRILSKNFSDFWPKNFKKFSKLPTCPEEKFVTWNFFLKFWIVLDFLQKPSAWFSIFYLRVQSKNCGKNSFFCIFPEFFSNFEQKLFRLLAKKLQEFVKTTFYVSRGTICGLIFFKFWNVSDFLQKHLAWFSKFYLRVQSKNCGKKVFFVFFPEFFRFLSKNFSDFWPKNFKNFSKLPSTCPEEQFVAWIFILSFESFWIVCRNLWHGSQNSIYVSRWKFAEEIFFLFFLSEFFSDFERKTFQTFGQKTSRICKNYLLRVQRNNLWLDFFLSFETFRIFCRNIWHGSQNSIYVSRVKIAEKNRFFVFFPEFFRILSKNFSDFWPKNFKKFSKLPTCPEEKFVSWNFFLKFWIVLEFLHKPSAWFSKFYLRVQSKNCGRNSFLIFFSDFFSDFEWKVFQTFDPKTSRSWKKLTSARPEEHFVTLILFKKILNRFGFSAETFGMAHKILSTCPE